MFCVNSDTDTTRLSTLTYYREILPQLTQSSDVRCSEYCVWSPRAQDVQVGWLGASWEWYIGIASRTAVH